MQEGNDNWVLGNTKMDMELMRVCRRWRKEISTDNWLHLLRCFRNLYRHYKDLRQPFSLPAIQPLFDWCPEGAYR